MSTQDSIDIDPVGMNIVNRIAPGTKFKGTLECTGGLMVQGQFEGELNIVGGPLVLMQDGVITGDVKCDQDAYLFGRIAPKESSEHSELDAGGAVFMAETMDAKANITASAIKTFEGAQVDGRIRVMRRERHVSKQ